MNTILFISILLLAAATFALRLRNRRLPPKEPDFFPEPDGFDGLFAEQHAEEMRLVAQAEGDEKALRSIAEYIVDSRALRPGADFPAMMIERWGEAPDQISFVGALHLAALSD